MAIAFVILVESVVLVSVVLVVECILTLTCHKNSNVFFTKSVLFLYCLSLFQSDFCFIHSTTSTTETSTTDSTRITNEMATSSDYLMKYFNGFLAVLLV